MMRKKGHPAKAKRKEVISERSPEEDKKRDREKRTRER